MDNSLTAIIKRYGEKRTTLPNTTLGVKGGSRFSVDNNRHSSSANAAIDKMNKMIFEPLSLKRIDYKIPFYPVKSFSKIKL
jgi:hypothetical protein